MTNASNTAQTPSEVIALDAHRGGAHAVTPAPACPACPMTAPDYTTRDTYAGVWTVTRPATHPQVATYTAAEIAALSPTGIIWESFGHLRNGREGFGRTRYIADADGNLHTYDQTGRKLLVHPAARSLRVLTR